MISGSVEAMRGQVAAWQMTLQNRGIASECWDGESAVGGGSLPGETLPTALLALSESTLGMNLDAAPAALRQCNVPTVCRIHQEHLIFDPRTVLPEQHETLLENIGQVA